MQLWRLAISKSAGVGGRLETLGKTALQVQRQSASKLSSSSELVSVFLKAFNCLDGTHSHYGR